MVPPLPTPLDPNVQRCVVDPRLPTHCAVPGGLYRVSDSRQPPLAVEGPTPLQNHDVPEGRMVRVHQLCSLQPPSRTCSPDLRQGRLEFLVRLLSVLSPGGRTQEHRSQPQGLPGANPPAVRERVGYR